MLVISLYCDASVNYADRRGVCFVIIVVVNVVFFQSKNVSEAMYCVLFSVLLYNSYYWYVSWIYIANNCYESNNKCLYSLLLIVCTACPAT